MVSWTLGANFEDMFLQGGAAIDATGNSLANVLRGNDAANVIRGLGGDDNLASAGGADRIEGGDGNDYIDAGDGDDVLVGGAGADTLVGGAGADRFVYQAASDSMNASLDAIYGFVSGSDVIDVAALRTGSADTFALVVTGGNTRLDIDLGGNGTADLSVLIAGVTNLTTGDIIWTGGSGALLAGDKAPETPEVSPLLDPLELVSGDKSADPAPDVLPGNLLTEVARDGIVQTGWGGMQIVAPFQFGFGKDGHTYSGWDTIGSDDYLQTDMAAFDTAMHGALAFEVSFHIAPDTLGDVAIFGW